MKPKSGHLLQSIILILFLLLPTMLVEYTSQYYIFHWTDTNGDGTPQPNEVAQV